MLNKACLEGRREVPQGELVHWQGIFHPMFPNCFDLLPCFYRFSWIFHSTFSRISPDCPRFSTQKTCPMSPPVDGTGLKALPHSLPSRVIGIFFSSQFSVQLRLEETHKKRKRKTVAGFLFFQNVRKRTKIFCLRQALIIG